MSQEFKALTICQPYAHLFTLPSTDPLHKRVENRPRPWSYRGDVAIHAGLSRLWMNSTEYGLSEAAMTFGAVVAIGRLIDCCSITDIRSSVFHKNHLTYRWIRQHHHTHGPYCLVFENIRALETPVPAKGKQGVWTWTAPDDLKLRKVE